MHHTAVQVAWLTPVEIFKPWYGYALAKYILEYHRHVLQEASPLTIYEVGGGTGTLATCVLVSLQHACAARCDSTAACDAWGCTGDRLAALGRHHAMQSTEHSAPLALLSASYMLVAQPHVGHTQQAICTCNTTAALAQQRCHSLSH